MLIIKKKLEKLAIITNSKVIKSNSYRLKIDIITSKPPLTPFRIIYHLECIPALKIGKI